MILHSLKMDFFYYKSNVFTYLEYSGILAKVNTQVC